MPDRLSTGSRVARLRSLLRRLSVDAVLILDLKNIRYLTGFSGSDGALLVGAGKPQLLVDGRYTTQASEQAPGARVVLYRDKASGIADALSAGGFEQVGFEPASVTVALHSALRRKAKNVRWNPLPSELGAIRAVKDKGEIESIRKAIRIATAALKSTLEWIRPGMCERDIAIELEYAMRRKGAEAPSFDTIIASGPNSALPHAQPGTRKIRPGDFVVVDFGAVCRGYHSDETCTFVVGRTGRKHERIYAVVKEAHDRALETISPGVACRAVDAAARGVIEKAGYGPFFSHGTGHGVGLDVHEAPRLSTLSDAVLEEGMVITIEPGIYIPGFGGVRIEDTALVGKAGARVLTEFSKELQVIG
ncbi:MAG TPA: Xaa-Pro peptidase family protein [Syntrophales bacterium]|nr:Xaa-Pro peptidase family protein [Syntrophales bacterium]